MTFPGSLNFRVLPMTSTYTERPYSRPFIDRCAHFIEKSAPEIRKIQGQRLLLFFCFFLQDFGAWVQQIRVLENTNKGRHGLCVIQDGHIKTSSHSASLIPLAGEIQEPPGHFHSGESASITHNSTNTQQSKISTAALFASLAYLELFILSLVQ